MDKPKLGIGVCIFLLLCCILLGCTGIEDLFILDDFIQEEQDEIKTEDFFLEKRVYSNNEERLKIYRYGNMLNASQFIKNQLFVLSKLFDPYDVPYPGPLSSLSICPEKYKPEITGFTDTEVEFVNISLYANNRYGYGICVDDLIEYKSTLQFVFCKDKNILYKIEYFFPPNSAPRHLFDFSIC